MEDAVPDREQVFEALFRAHVSAVRRYTRTMVDDRHVEDVVAQTFSTAWQRLDDVPMTSLRPWLFGVTRNHCRNVWRSDRRSRALFDRVALDRSEIAGPIEASVDIDPLLQVIRELDDVDRELMVMTGWFEMTPTEIATATGEEPGTVRVRLHRLRQRVGLRFEQLAEGGDVA